MHALRQSIIPRCLRPVATLRAAAILMAGGLLAACLTLTERTGDAAFAAATPPIAVSPGQAQKPVSLRDRLVVGLQARLRSEVVFVEAVVARVHSGQLPQRLVDETFFWARGRASDGRYGRPRRPILYFRPAMTARAKRLNVAL